MKIQIDSFLKPDDLAGSSREKPKQAVILDLKLIPAEDLGFDSKEPRHELTLDIDGDTFTWLINKTSLRAIKTAYGAESDNWITKPIKLYAIDQQVGKELKKVIYASV